eukprot:3939848-Rhodomonas_salina.1
MAAPPNTPNAMDMILPHEGPFLEFSSGLISPSNAETTSSSSPPSTSFVIRSPNIGSKELALGASRSEAGTVPIGGASTICRNPA